MNLIWCNTIVVWFASFHALPVTLLNYFFNKRLIIIAGGFDVANVPNINYGAMRGKSRATLGKWLLSRAHSVIAVSKSNKQEILMNGTVPPEKIHLIYNAVPKKDYHQSIDKKQQVLTVGEINEETYLRKGLDRFIKVAEKLPHIQFIHIGKWTDNKGNSCQKMINYVKQISPENIQYLGFVKKEVLEQYYSESKGYLQLSRHEAFGVSVVEAMKYHCIPIVTNVFALPEIVGKCGYIIQNKIQCINLIKRLIKDNSPMKININPKFYLNFREESFKNLLSN